MVTQADPEEESQPDLMASPNHSRWLWSLLVNVALAQASIYVMRPMITYRALENGASSLEVGLIAAIYALLPILIAVPMGRWIGRFGELPLLFAGCLSFVLFGFSFTFLNDVFAIAAITAFVGVAHLSNVAASQAMVANKSPVELQDRNFGYFSFSASLGHTFGPLLGGLLAGSAGVLPRSSSTAFVFAALLATVALVPILMMRDLQKLTSQADREIAGAVRARDVVTRPGMKPAIWTSLTVSATNDVLVVVLPLVGTERGISPVVIGAILSLRSGAAMISRFSLGRLTARFGSTPVMNYSIWVSALLLFAIAFATTSTPLAILMSLLGFALGIGQPLTMSIVSKQSPISERAMAISVRLFGNRLGQFAVPLGAGALAAPFGSSAAFLGLAALVASAGIVN